MTEMKYSIFDRKAPECHKCAAILSLSGITSTLLHLKQKDNSLYALPPHISQSPIL